MCADTHKIQAPCEKNSNGEFKKTAIGQNPKGSPATFPLKKTRETDKRNGGEPKRKENPNLELRNLIGSIEKIRCKIGKPQQKRRFLPNFGPQAGGETAFLRFFSELKENAFRSSQIKRQNRERKEFRHAPSKRSRISERVSLYTKCVEIYTHKIQASGKKSSNGEFEKTAIGGNLKGSPATFPRKKGRETE